MENKKSIGGVARAAKLTKQQRSDIAKKAAEKRWAGESLQADFEGEITVGEAHIQAAVLPDGSRILTQSAFLTAIGRSRTPKAGTGALTVDVDELPFFLSADVLKPYINKDIALSTKPIHFLSKNGIRRVGYDAQLLPMVCEVYLKFRDDCLIKSGVVPARYAHIVATCDALMRGLAHVGIMSLVDEATGYQEVRDKKALQAILDRFLAKELAAWAKRFPDEFYQQMFRLKSWAFNPMSVARPGVVGKYTIDIVYERLAPGLVSELESLNPKGGTGTRRSKHHQWLSHEIGHPALAQHLHGVIGLMRASADWDQFLFLLDRAYPKKGHTIPLLLE